MSVKVEFPKTDIIGCRFLKYDRVHSMSVPYDVFNGKQSGWNIDTDPKDKVYYYKVIDGIKPVVGDIVVVSCATGLSLAEVVEVDCISVRKYPAYVIATVDMNNYREFMEREKRKAHLAAVLKERKESLEKEAMYDMLAEKDPEFADMLKQFKELGGTFNNVE